MPVALLTIELRIEHAQTLKDRRQVVRSIKDSLQNNFNVSAAEMDDTPALQRASIAVAAVSNSRDYLDGLMQQIERAVYRLANDRGADVTDIFWRLMDE